MAILALIPARGGSKGIPLKNIVNLMGKPLLSYTAQAALKSGCFSKVVLSTDSEEIQKIGTSLGLNCDNLRPHHLAQDNTPMIEVLKYEAQRHSLKSDDAICLLQPTSPLRDHIHIQECVSIYLQNIFDSVVSVQEVPHQFSPSSLMNLEGKLLQKTFSTLPVYTDRQSKPKHYVRNGPSILISKISTIERGELYGKNVGAYLMDARSSLDIDQPDDLELANFYLQQKKK